MLSEYYSLRGSHIVTGFRLVPKLVTWYHLDARCNDSHTLRYVLQSAKSMSDWLKIDQSDRSVCQEMQPKKNQFLAVYYLQQHSKRLPKTRVLRGTVLSKAVYIFWQKSTITGKRWEIWCELVLFTNMKSHTGFRLVSKLVTLNDLELCNWTAVAELLVGSAVKQCNPKPVQIYILWFFCSCFAYHLLV